MTAGCSTLFSTRARCAWSGCPPSWRTGRSPSTSYAPGCCTPPPAKPPVTPPSTSCPRSLEQEATVDGQGDASDVPGLVGGQEQEGVGDVDRFHPRNRQ